MTTQHLTLDFVRSLMLSAAERARETPLSPAECVKAVLADLGLDEAPREEPVELRYEADFAVRPLPRRGFSVNT